MTNIVKSEHQNDVRLKKFDVKYYKGLYENNYVYISTYMISIIMELH
jgi:hypothetical protein